MIRPWQTATALGLCFAVLLSAMGWSSWTVLRLDKAQQKARHKADLEENVRLALWRMDSALTPIIAQESVRPYASYKSFYHPTSPFNCGPPVAKANDKLVPSPILIQLPPHVLLHFQLNPEGHLTSPQAPTGPKRTLAAEGCTTIKNIDTATQRLEQFKLMISRDDLITALRRRERIAQACKPPPAQHPELMERQSSSAQVLLSVNELDARTQNVNTQWQMAGPTLFQFNERDAVMKPLWVGDLLLLTRQVLYDGQDYFQGCWLDWSSMKQWLLASVENLLPDANLEPLRGDSGNTGSRRLAALPVVLGPGALTSESLTVSSPVLISLLVAWGCVVLAAAAVAVLLLGVMTLSERRAAFVSAVTHELRTPLTTFRMYSEMLAKGMVTDESKRKRYLSTLYTEAERLSHLVGNVLAYARIEKNGRASDRLETVEVGELLDRTQERLTERARQANMQLQVTTPSEPQAGTSHASARVDTAAVEQILFNLVDNACKYASPESTGTIHVRAKTSPGRIDLQVQDSGPGISKREARRLFRPFSKSASEAANSAPGVGLGLALSRRLARSMGGDLQLDPTVKDGACFVLSLPVG